MTKRIATGAVTTILLVLGVTGTAAADNPGNGLGNGQGQGLPGCFGPPGQTGLVLLAQSLQMPPGQFVSHCNGNGHGQNQGDGSVSG